jgi:sugar (pentulose or hexulose) kinase
MSDAYIGIDLGTSGCRAVAVNSAGVVLAEQRRSLPAPLTPRDGWVEQDPLLWWEAVREVLGQLTAELTGVRVRALCVDGTSATLLLADRDGRPLTPALLYNDRRALDAAAAVDAVAPRDSAARGAGSSLSKLICLAQGLADAGNLPPDSLALHQADWIAGRLTARYGPSDWNNALKLGYDAELMAWPGWVRGLVPEAVRLPEVVAPGAELAPLTPGLAAELGLDPDVRVVAGTTDSTAAVLAAGAREPGDAVTCLGSTLVMKVVARRSLTASRYGIYSHRLGDLWLVGGASNSGGAVLRQHFSDEELKALSALIDPERPTGLDYYPLPRPGERFPRADPRLAARITPVPEDRVRFLHGLLEGMARIEAEGYALLCRLGAPAPTHVLTTGGGSVNAVWEAIRHRALGVPVRAAVHQEAAYGSAMLALRGAGCAAPCGLAD